jgi:hypothetical protein
MSLTKSLLILSAVILSIPAAWSAERDPAGTEGTQETTEVSAPREAQESQDEERSETTSYSTHDAGTTGFRWREARINAED